MNPPQQQPPNTPPSPRLLVSVRNAPEAQIAADNGAALIDIKDPARGPLGRPAPYTINAVLAAVSQTHPVSCALGELHELAAQPLAPINNQLAFIKLGLANAPTDWRQQLAAICDHTGPARMIAAAYADHRRVAAPPAHKILAWAATHHAAGILIDTAVKDGQTLFDYFDESALHTLIADAHHHGLTIALAGSLSQDLAARAAALGPDIIAVRGAACASGDRQAPIAPDRVRSLVTRLAAPHASAHRRVG